MAVKLSKVNFNDYKPLRDVIFNTIREAIIAGELKPGERLMEVQLADKMGVSRTPVREAIRKLELEGLVEMIPRKGAHVAEVSVKDIMDVLEIRASMDGLATALAAKRITPEEIKELKHVYSQFVTNVEKENVNGTIKKDAEFHDVIYRASRNDKLLQISNNLKEQVQRFRVIYLKGFGSTGDIIKEHEQIIEAITTKNPEMAQKIAYEHIRTQEETIIKALRGNSI